MKDDPEFNIQFVSIIEHFPCLFDYTCADYSKRNVVDNAWERIAKEISEPIQDCKERWKNLRACYTRHLKTLINTPSGSEAKAKRPYYLAEHLHFLRPYTKSRKSKGICNVTQLPISSPQETEIVECEIRDSEEEQQNSLSDYEVSNDEDPSKTSLSKKNAQSKFNLKKPDISLAEVKTLAHDYFLSKTSTKDKKIENPDLDFLKSILPDMKEMTNAQKRRFKIGILNLAGQILSENEST